MSAEMWLWLGFQTSDAIIAFFLGMALSQSMRWDYFEPNLNWFKRYSKAMLLLGLLLWICGQMLIDQRHVLQILGNSHSTWNNR